MQIRATTPLCAAIAAALLVGCGSSAEPLLPPSDQNNPTGPTYSVSGRVTDRAGNGAGGVVLTFDGHGSAVSDADGNWSKTGLRGEVSVTASKQGWFLRPSSTTVEAQASDLSFVATPSVIAFVSDRGGEASDGFRSIYVMGSDGSNPTRLVNSGRDNLAPAWSPDGRRIAFESFDGTQRDIYVMDADGANVVRLTNDLADDISPAWSPDGRFIAFVSYRGGLPAIFVMEPDGSRQTQVAGTVGAREYGALLDQFGFPSWSPDGRVLAYTNGAHIFFRYFEGFNVGEGEFYFSGASYCDGAPVWSVGSPGTELEFAL